MTDKKSDGESRAFYHQLYAGVATGLGGSVMLYAMNFPTFGIPSMVRDKNFDISPQQCTLVGSLTPLAGIVGNVLAGVLMEKIGRKNAMLVGTLVFSISFPMLAVASEAWYALVSRFLMGIGSSLVMIGGMVYLAEVLQPSLRDRINSYVGVLINTGMLLAFALGSAFEWRATTWMGMLLILPLMAMLINIKESPLFYVKTGNVDEALASLKWFRPSASEASKELKDLVASAKKTDEAKVSLSDMLKAPYSTPVMASMLLLIAQQLTGITAITTYSVDIFQAIGTSIDTAYCTVMIAVINICATILGAEIHSRFDRKETLLVTTLLCANMQLFFGGFLWAKSSEIEYLTKWTSDNSHLGLISILIYYISFTIGLGVLPFMYMSEALPSKIRGPASAMALTFNTVFIFIILETFQPLVAILGYHYLFIIQAVCTTVLVIYVYTLMIETREKSGTEIDEYYNSLIAKKQR